MKQIKIIPLVLLLLAVSAIGATTPRERLSLNAGWRFTLSDAAECGTNFNYAYLRPWLLPAANAFTTGAPATRPTEEPGGKISFAQPDFDDGQWRLLNLPHDWGIEGPFKFEYPGETGKLAWWGTAWYRRHLDLPAADAGKKIFLDVDGAMSHAAVWLNGKFVGGWPYGYASWRLDLTPFVNFGGDNVLAIRLDNPPGSSRWYPGGGIYRNVWLVKTAPVHIGQWGIQILSSDVTKDYAEVGLEVDLVNDSAAETKVTAQIKVFELNAAGLKSKQVETYPGEKSERLENLANEDNTFNTFKMSPGDKLGIFPNVKLSKPKLWSIAHPNRYVAVTTIYQGGKIVDEVETPFGIRTFEFTATKGFLLNGQRVPLNGVCNHSDLGALGSAINVRGLERQIEILQAMGCNAIRTSHNPPSPELLDLCDRMGMLVMDEAFDCWKEGKHKNDYHILYPDWHEADLRALVRRDRNHPSVVLWSIGNEVPDQGSVAGRKIAAELRDIVRSEDSTRPVTAACDRIPSGYNEFREGVDVFGYNYKPTEYAKFRAANPVQPLFSSESASCCSSRGEYQFPVTANKADGVMRYQVSSYDLYAPRWATPPEWEFKAQDEFSFVAGEFVWTGFDYLGEPTPFFSGASLLSNMHDPVEKARLQKEMDQYGSIKVPSRSAYFGIIDLAGFPKDRYYIYQAHWRPDFPMAHILPHWNWPERVGQVTPVHVYTSGDEAELFLNGKSLGRKKKGALEYRLRWDDVVYQPGELKVVAYKNGKPWAKDTMKTTGEPAKLLLQADRKKISADGQDLSFITVTVADKDGLLVPHSHNHIKFELTGPGEIVATDNGNATSFESFKLPEHDAFNGLALVVVRSQAGASGTIELKATAPDLKPATIKLVAKSEK